MEGGACQGVSTEQLPETYFWRGAFNSFYSGIHYKYRKTDRQTDRQTKSFIYPFVHSITVTVIPIN